MFALTPGKAVPVGNGIWRLLALNPGMMSGPGTNTYLIAAGDGLWVLDPGPEDSRHVDNLAAASAEIGRPVTAVLCTHTHRDHSPCTALVKERFPVRVLGPAPLDDALQDHSWQPDEVLVDGQVLDLGGAALKVIATPGHVSNHLCFLHQQEGLLFSGDHLINGSTVVIAPPAGSMRAYLDSLRKLQGETLRAIAPGHGDLIADPAQAIAGTIAHRLQREDKVLDALSRTSVCTPADLVAQVYQDVPAFLHPVAEFSLHAHLIKLVEDGRAESPEDGCYRLKHG